MRTRLFWGDFRRPNLKSTIKVQSPRRLVYRREKVRDKKGGDVPPPTPRRKDGPVKQPGLEGTKRGPTTRDCQFLSPIELEQKRRSRGSFIWAVELITTQLSESTTITTTVLNYF